MITEETRTQFPFVSVIIPVLNGENHISQCLDSVCKINYPAERYEVILVDNGSTDQTLQIAKSYDIQVLQRPDVTIATVRNCGAQYASGNILAFLDSDCTPTENWLKNAIQYFFSHDKIGMVGSLVRSPGNCSWVARIWDLCYRKRTFHGNTDRLGAANMIIKKQLFLSLGGFNEDLVTGEDDDLCFRIRKSGFKIYSDPAVTVYHLGEPGSILQFFRKEVWRGYETFRLFIKTKGKMNFKITMFALFNLMVILFIIGSATFALFSGSGYTVTVISAVPLFSFPFFLAIKAAGYTHKWKYIFHFFLLFFTLGLARALAILRITSI